MLANFKNITSFTHHPKGTVSCPFIISKRSKNFPPHIQNNVKCNPNCPEGYQFRAIIPWMIETEVVVVAEDERFAAEMMHSR